MYRALLATLLTLVIPAAALADPPDQVLARDLSPVPAAAVDAAANNQVTRTLVFQHRFGDDVPFAKAVWTGTHNSFNSLAEMGLLPSPMDGNQRISLVDQLRIGVRSLELDLHGLPHGIVVCHGSGPVGCSAEKSLRVVLGELDGWLSAHPGEVVLLYLEDQIGDAATHDTAAAIVRDVLGAKLWTPQAQTGCSQLPLTASRNTVRAAGAQVVVVGSCGAGDQWGRLSFAWDRVHVESRPRGFANCVQSDVALTDYAAGLVRFYEDSTFVNFATSAAGQAHEDDGLTESTVRSMVSCGVGLFGFDQLQPDDRRLAALVWSWEFGQPSAGGSCAFARPSGRWTTDGSCAALRAAACRRPADGSWIVPAVAAARPAADGICQSVGATLAAPRTGAESAALRAAAAGRSAWLGVQPVASDWVATDTR